MADELRPSSRLVAGLLRAALRRLWAPVVVASVRLRVWLWGAPALEQAAAHCPPWLGLAVLKAFGARIGHGVDFHGRLRLHGAYRPAGKLIVGNWCHIGPGVTLDLSAPIVLEDRCTIALNAQILTHHDVGYSPLAARAYPTRFAGVTVEAGAFVGAGATLLPGVRIGRCAVVGAGALVTDDVPPYTVVAGAPARVIRQLDPAEAEPSS